MPITFSFGVQELPSEHSRSVLLHTRLEAQTASFLVHHGSGTAVAKTILKLLISKQTLFRWKKKFAGLGGACALAATTESAERSSGLRSVR